MSDFFRFPHTPHLVWLGTKTPRDDKVLGSPEARQLLAGDVVVEEKLDGANIGFSLGPGRTLRVQNRGQYLEPPFRGQFARLASWLQEHGQGLMATLRPDIILFGEWCAARHSIAYNQLGDWFVVFDVYDRRSGQFWSTARRNALAAGMGLTVVPPVFAGHVAIGDLKQIVLSEASRFGAPHVEGVVIRRETSDWLEARAKLVRPDFTQAITEHWTRRKMEWNSIKEARQRADPAIAGY